MPIKRDMSGTEKIETTSVVEGPDDHHHLPSLNPSYPFAATSSHFFL